MREEAVTVVPQRDHTGSPGGPATTGSGAGQEAGIGELLRRLTTDTGELVRQEIALARTELRESTSGLKGDATRIGIAAGLAIVGAMALTAFVIIGLGQILNGAYWLSALIVALFVLGTSAVLLRSAMADIRRRRLVPAQTLETLREDRDWASRQARELRAELTATPPIHHPGHSVATTPGIRPGT